MFQSYSKTPHFKDVVKTVQHTNNFVGLDAEGIPIYEDRELPTVRFVGSVKLHGTNAAIGYKFDAANFNPDNVWFQSRSHVVENGHFGFAQSINKEDINNAIVWIIKNQTNYQETIYPDSIVMYGEWAGEGIQKGVAISKLPKRFYVFAAKAIYEYGEIWLDIVNMPRFGNIDCVYNYDYFELNIDFNNTKLAQEHIDNIVAMVEKQCPVAHANGVDGVGEGVVWIGEFKGQRLIFKTKGEAHSVVQKDTKFTLSGDVMEKIQQFVQYSVTKPRLEQCLFELNLQPERKNTGAVIKWMSKDISSEETNTLQELQLDWHLVEKYVNQAVSKLFLGECNG